MRSVDWTTRTRIRTSSSVAGAHPLPNSLSLTTSSRTGHAFTQIQHLIPNTPCIFTPHLIASWPCLASFLHPSPAEPSTVPRSINHAHLLHLQGSTPVSVHRPSTEEERDNGEGLTVCEDRPLAEVFDLWKQGSEEGEGMYVKDWHLAQQVLREGGQPFYETPDVFKDDWLNGWYRATGRDDFRFIVSSPSGPFFI